MDRSEIGRRVADELEAAQSWVAGYAGDPTDRDDAVSEALRDVWQELGYRAHMIREMTEAGLYG